MFRNKASFYVKEILALRPTSKLDEQQGPTHHGLFLTEYDIYLESQMIKYSKINITIKESLNNRR